MHSLRLDSAPTTNSHRVKFFELREAGLVLFGLVLPIVLVLLPVFSTRFVLFDDQHDINLYSRMATTSFPQSLWLSIRTDFVGNGRIRPVYFAIRHILMAVFGSNPYTLHAVMAALGLLTALLLYESFRFLGLGVVAAIVSTHLVVLAPYASSVWIELGPAESWATVFLTISLFAMVRAAYQKQPTHWDIVLITGVFLASLCKETFILTLPALAWGRVALWAKVHGQTLSAAWRIHRRLLFFLLVLLGFLLVASYLVILWGGYFGGKITTAGMATPYLLLRGIWREIVASTSLTILPGYGLVVFVVAVLAFAYWRAGAGSVRWLIWGGIFVALGVLPQVAIYATRTGFGRGRYWYPALIFGGIANALCLLWLQNYWRQAIYFVCLLWLALYGIVLGGIRANDYARSLQAQSDAAHQMITYLGNHIPSNAALGIVARPMDWEAITSVQTLLKNAGHADISYYLILVQPESSYSAYEQSLFEDLTARYPRGVTTISPDSIDALVLFQDPNGVPERYAPWITQSRFVPRSFMAEPRDLSLGDWSMAPSTTARYRILIAE